MWAFLTRTQGRGRLTLADWATYSYLFFGFLIIFVPVVWLALNSVKTAFQIERQDTSLIPGDFTRVARATVEGPDGKEIFFIEGLPAWVLGWRDLSPEEKAAQDVAGLLGSYDGNAALALRSHLERVGPQARALIADKGLPEWLLRYNSMNNVSRAEVDIESVFSGLTPEQDRLLREFTGLLPGARLTTQILVSAPDPETGAIRNWGVSNVDPNRELTPGRPVDAVNAKVVRLPTETLELNREVKLAWENYAEPLSGDSYGVTVDFSRCIANSLIVTIVATLVTLLINSMAAFSLSKYQFRGQVVFLAVILATLMVPPTITLVGVFKAIQATGMSGSLWGVIIPGAATPAGVFMLRQYMLTIPDELIEASRMDAASEWKIFWRIVLPLALPAIAALGILSIVWRWNDLILPLVAVATVKEAYTIQLCLLEFRGEHTSQEHYRLAMTIVSLIPTTLVFVFLQRYITTGIANSGMK